MQNIISIPLPCNENWNDMTPNAQGRHCGACEKTVVDFTTWETPEIILYLEMNAAKNVCGRFTEAQLEEKIPMPQEFVRMLSSFPISALKKTAAVLIFAFLLSSDAPAQTVKGKTIAHTASTPKLLGEPAMTFTGAPVTTMQDSTKKVKPQSKKPVCNNPIIMGIIAPPTKPQPKPVKPKTEIIVGKVAPQDPAKTNKVAK